MFNYANVDQVNKRTPFNSNEHIHVQNAGVCHDYWPVSRESIQKAGICHGGVHRSASLRHTRTPKPAPASDILLEEKASSQVRRPCRKTHPRPRPQGVLRPLADRDKAPCFGCRSTEAAAFRDKPPCFGQAAQTPSSNKAITDVILIIAPTNRDNCACAHAQRRLRSRYWRESIAPMSTC